MLEAEIEHELQTRSGVALHQRVGDHGQQQEQQQRHQQAHGRLDTPAQAAADDEAAHQHEDRVPAAQAQGVAIQIGVQGLGGLFGQTREGAAHRQEQVVDGASSDDAVEGHDQVAGKQPMPPIRPQDAPAPAFGRHRGHRGVGTGAAVAAYGHFRREDRDRHQESSDQVYEHEGAAAVLAHDVRETPNVSQADGATDGGNQKGASRTPAPGGGILLHALPVSFLNRPNNATRSPGREGKMPFFSGRRLGTRASCPRRNNDAIGWRAGSPLSQG